MLEQETKDMLQEALNARLRFWQEDPESGEKATKFKELIETQELDRIGFLVKVKKGVLLNTGPRSQAISIENVNNYATIEEDQIVFEIPAKTEFYEPERFKLRISARSNFLTISNGEVGAIGIFTPQEVTSITLQ